MKHSRAFSLVELSIVLVILGLLVGGILAGQSLIRAAELRSVPTDINRFQTAIFTFRDKYFALPGDMSNATSFWGTAAGTGSDNACYTFASTSPATCNGNGDGLISYPVGAGLYGEMHRSWQHLANDGLIEGSYTGADTVTVLGVTSPKSKIANAGFEIINSVHNSYWGESFSNASNGHTLFFGTLAGIPRNVALRPEEAWNIDTKIDDGKPDNGRLQTDTLYSAACFTGAYPNAAYALSTTSIQCSFRYSLR